MSPEQKELLLKEFESSQNDRQKLQEKRDVVEQKEQLQDIKTASESLDEYLDSPINEKNNRQKNSETNKTVELHNEKQKNFSLNDVANLIILLLEKLGFKKEHSANKAKETDRDKVSPKESTGYMTDGAEKLLEDWGYLTPGGKDIIFFRQLVTGATGVEMKNISKENYESKKGTLLYSVEFNDGSVETFRIGSMGNVSRLDQSKALLVSDIMGKNNVEGGIFREMRVNDTDASLVSALRILKEKGISLDNTTGNTVEFLRGNEVVGRFSGFYTNDEWKSGFESACRDAITSPHG